MNLLWTVVGTLAAGAFLMWLCSKIFGDQKKSVKDQVAVICKELKCVDGLQNMLEKYDFVLSAIRMYDFELKEYGYADLRDFHHASLLSLQRAIHVQEDRAHVLKTTYEGYVNNPNKSAQERAIAKLSHEAAFDRGVQLQSEYRTLYHRLAPVESVMAFAA